MSSEDVLAPEDIYAVLEAFEAGDTATASEFWADDGVFVDPHYPEPTYRGPDEVRAALDWALEHVVDRPGLTVRTVWEDGETFAVEVDTHHVAHDGEVLEFPQVFVVEGENGRVARWRSYLPFPPPADEE